ncbi:SpoIIE family protein phosphatase [Natronosporangium hydrolyticum]|uniref:SpoIIE family protein phosphatase n=1 Tax=Natronosporangium hydrolyticum TaxID=2811111 RepID=A0A895Y657_9ACTN|nr:SpoIIE family protein phosphatase [Natronosporangium hydrolyticum]QSB13214.1 SpoIIE family protein phosphatase [Natronosporangium hydrolyticum]
MTAPVTIPEYQTLSVPIDHESAVAYASGLARERAADYQLSGGLIEQAAVVASELASNIYKHAAGGFLLLGPAAPGAGLHIWALDTGPGMADLQQCLVDGYSTTGTLGAGLGAVRRMATDAAIWSRPAQGTVISARLHAGRGGPATLPGIDAAAFCLAADLGRDLSGDDMVPGDAYAFAEPPAGATLLVVDGLGHGPDAAAAASAAVTAFGAQADQPLPGLLTYLHRALRGTRGAAATVLRIHPDRIDSCGVGNISGVILRAGRPGQQLVGQPGTLGVRIPAPQVRPYQLRAGDTLVLFSDGITSHWWREADGEVLYQPPGTLLGYLAGWHRCRHDDATAVALRPTRLRHAAD